MSDFPLQKRRVAVFIQKLVFSAMFLLSGASYAGKAVAMEETISRSVAVASTVRVPEPSTMVFIAVGGLLLTYIFRPRTR